MVDLPTVLISVVLSVAVNLVFVEWRVARYRRRRREHAREKARRVSNWNPRR